MSQREGPPRLYGVRIRGKQVAAGVLGLSAVVVGAWAAAAPDSFFSSFPLPGHHWVTPLGPYNEHMTRDVGGLHLSLFVVSRVGRDAAATRDVRAGGRGLAGVQRPAPRLPLHAPGHVLRRRALGNVVTLGGTVVLAALLLLPNDQHAVSPATGLRRPRAGRRRA